MKKKNLLFLLLILAVAVYALFKPAIIGYSTYHALKRNNITLNDIVTGRIEREKFLTLQNFTQKRIKGLEEIVKNLKSEIRDLNKTLNMTVNGKDKEIKSWMDKLTIANAKLEQKEEALKKSSENYYKLAENSARIICCIAKLDNPTISYYRVRDNKIVCDEHSGYKLKCSFD